MFSEEAHLTGTCLYLDLDIVILDNIDEIATIGNDMTFGVSNDFNPKTKEFNSSVMKFNNDVATKAIWSKFLEKKAKLMELQGDQNVMSKLIKGNDNLKVMPDEWTFSYKWYSRTDPRFAKDRWTFEKKQNAKIAVFHGEPRPHESNEKWVQKEWN